MTGFLALISDYFAGKALDTAGRILSEVATGQNQFEEIRQRMGGEAAFEFTLAFERHVRDQETRDAEFRSKLREKVTEREVCALFPALLRAASDSSTRERMRMLCAALAGLWRPDLEAEMRSRIGRAILELEPSDVLYLRTLAQDEGRPGATLRLGPQGEWLLRAACVADDSSRIGGAIRVTALGHDLLASLSTWTPEE